MLGQKLLMRTAGGKLKSEYTGASTVTSSTSSTATAFNSQRKVDRTSNNILWAIVSTALGTIASMYSTDDGVTWSAPVSIITGASGTPIVNGSFFIDQDDYAHLVYKNRTDGFIYYRRGTPNVGRTSWTWSGASLVYNTNTTGDYPDIVAHREGTGWKAHIVVSSLISSNNYALYYPVTITSAGVITVGASVTIGGGYGINTHVYPSLDFNHNGDGKTIKNSTPHLYVSWTAGNIGAGLGVRFKKASYSAGTWTWGTEREIDTTGYISSVAYWLNCIFDGTRVVMVGMVFLSVGGARSLMLYERDAADTTTTVIPLVPNSPTDLLYGSAAYDEFGNLYIFGCSFSPNHINYRSWKRAGKVVGSLVSLESSTPASAHVRARRCYSGDRVEFIATKTDSSPYSIMYGALK